MAKVKRKPTGVRRSAAAHNRSQKARAAKRHTSGLLDRAMAALPFTEEQWHRFFLVAIIAAGAAIAWTIASFAGVPEIARTELAKSASRSGFEVSRVRVSGVERMNEQLVYERVLGEQELGSLRKEAMSLSSRSTRSRILARVSAGRSGSSSSSAKSLR